MLAKLYSIEGTIFASPLLQYTQANTTISRAPYPHNRNGFFKIVDFKNPLQSVLLLYLFCIDENNWDFYRLWFINNLNVSSDFVLIAEQYF